MLLFCVFKKTQTLLWAHLGNSCPSTRGYSEAGGPGGRCVPAQHPVASAPHLDSVAPKPRVCLRLGSQDRVPASPELGAVPSPVLSGLCSLCLTCAHTPHPPHRSPGPNTRAHAHPTAHKAGGLLPAFADMSSSLRVLSPSPCPPLTPQKGSVLASHPAVPLSARCGALAVRTGPYTSVRVSPRASSVGKHGRPSSPAESVTGHTLVAHQVSSGDPKGSRAWRGRVGKGRRWPLSGVLGLVPGREEAGSAHKSHGL